MANEPVETTLEEARRCSKCQQPGDLVKKEPFKGQRSAATRGAMLHHFECRNNRCKWFGTIVRIVQVNPDGSIPNPILKRDKEFPKIPDLSARVNEQLARQLVMERTQGAEITK